MTEQNQAAPILNSQVTTVPIDAALNLSTNIEPNAISSMTMESESPVVNAPKPTPETQKMQDGAGRPSELTDDVLRKIKQSVLDGKTLIQIAEELGISERTFYDWTYENYRNLSDLIDGWKRDRKLKLAEKNIAEMLTMSTEVEVIGAFGPIIDKETGKRVKKTSTELIKIKKDVSTFVAETLGKDKGYSKRQEYTGADGEALRLTFIEVDPNDQTKGDHNDDQQSSVLSTDSETEPGVEDSQAS